MRSAHPRLLAVGLAALALATGCARVRQPAGTRFEWVAAHPAPAFDPAGPPEPLRAALERLLSRGLVDLDPSGRVMPAGAGRWSWSAGGRTLTFHLRRGLTFTDGAPCASRDFARALTTGLSRRDHATQAWLLRAVAGVAFGGATAAHRREAAGRVAGILTPDDSTLVLALVAPDPRLLEALALPGVSTPWREGAVDWAHAIGIGPYRLAAAEGPAAAPHALLCVRTAAFAGRGPDTVRVRFQPAAARVLAALRSGGVDRVWPAPPGLLRALLPNGYARRHADAKPVRRLVLVMRHDLPPTSRAAAREALAMAIRPGEVLEMLGATAAPVTRWLPGAGARDAATQDAEGARARLASDHLGRSFHAQLTYDPSEEGAAVARLLQGQWSAIGIDIELEPVNGRPKGGAWPGADAALALVTGAPLFDTAEAEWMRYTETPRGPCVGDVATGWRVQRPAQGFSDAAALQDRLEQERVAVPLADLPWWWIDRTGADSTWIHPRYGPECAEISGASGAH